MESFETLSKKRDYTEDEYALFNNNKQSLLQIFSDEAVYWHQRAKKQWLKDGDANSSYFHKIASFQRKSNHIISLDVDGVQVTDNNIIKRHAFQFYKNLLGNYTIPSVKLTDTLWNEADKVISEENLELIKPFSMNEIKIAIFEMDPNKALGPDGFSILFYQSYWETIKHDLVLMFQDFHNNTLQIKLLYRAIICLIPKLKDASNLSDFMPISLLNCSYKIFTKVIANRLYPVLDRLISKNQTTFLKGKNIMEGVITAHEILHSVHTTKEQG